MHHSAGAGVTETDARVLEMLQGLPVLPLRPRAQTLSDRAERREETPIRRPCRAPWRQGGVSLEKASGVGLAERRPEGEGVRQAQNWGTEWEGDRHRQVQVMLHPPGLGEGLGLCSRAVGSTQWFQNGDNSNEPMNGGK